MFEKAKELTLNHWMALAMPDERIFGLYLGSALIMAFGTWLYYRYLAKSVKPDNVDKGALAFIFDKGVLFHSSSKQDFWYFLINGIIYIGLISQVLISTHFFMMMFYGGLQNLFGDEAAGLLPASWLTLMLYTIIYALFLDFAVYATHLMQHKIPVLWEFHKVHHSAEVLTPLTLYRMHPVDLFLTGIIVALLTGLAFAGFYYLTGETPRAYEMMGLNIIVFVFYLLGYNLRHSHIWLAYPAWLSHIMISPAQHQIHHSTAPQHFDKNLGLIFAFWDKLFGTLYVPKNYEKISYGLNQKKPNPFNSVWDLYAQPVRNAWQLLCPERSATRFLMVSGIILVCAINYAAFYKLDRSLLAEQAPLPSVHIEALTWTEIDRALHQRGYDTILIATGGTEQNGPHMVTGKHNIIVRHTAEAIAKKVGGILVAPVIAFVPEDVHASYAGTLSVPQDVYESLLEATAENYIKQGFKNILFIGDSAGNQDGQAKVAVALNARHKDNGITAAHIATYYDPKRQISWLMSKGYKLEQIGSHAGMLGTSELIKIAPDGIRRTPWHVEDRDSGHSGHPELANKKLGEELLQMKIDAAAEQIKAILGDGRKITP